jgi:hypothetical protein
LWHAGPVTIPVPEHVTLVEDCTRTGSMRWHETTCVLRGLPAGQAQAAAEAAEQRLAAFTADLNQQFHAEGTGVRTSPGRR